MGTRSFGTGPGSNSHYFYITGGNTEMKADVAVSAPENMYVDSIYVYCSTQNGSAATAKNALYHSGGTLETQTALYTLSGGAGWQGQGIGLPYFYIVSGSPMEGAVWTNTNGLQMYALLDGNPFDYGFSTFANPWSGGNTKSGWGGLAWYATYFPVCSISSISPTHAQEGATINVYGQSFSAGVNSVTVNGTGASWGYVNDGQINVVIPGGATSGAIVVNTNAGSGTSGTFTVDPTISSISPTHGAPGNGVTINGSGLTGVTLVYFTSGVGAGFSVNSDTQISTTVPSGAVTGAIQIQKPSATSYNSGTFTIDSTLTSFTPTFGGVGTSVTLTGVGFTGASAVKFNGTSASYTVNSDTQITTTVPSGATTGPISVTCTGGTVSSGSNFIMAAGWYHSGGTLHHFQGIWYKHGGTLHPLQGMWYHSGGVINPLK